MGGVRRRVGDGWFADLPEVADAWWLDDAVPVSVSVGEPVEAGPSLVLRGHVLSVEDDLTFLASCGGLLVHARSSTAYAEDEAICITFTPVETGRRTLRARRS